jgi:threonine/homoserine/homoserine lactone efflux protein
MPDLQLILVGAIIGLLVAAPVGPVNVMCIQRTLERGFWGGLAAGLGAVIGDGLIAYVAALGITAITDAIHNFRTGIKLVGGTILLTFGLRLFFARPPVNGSASASSRSAHGLVIPQTFFLTITNPGAVLGMFGIVGSVGTALGGFPTYADAGVFVLAVMGGSLLWWAGLSHLISRLHHRLTPRRLVQINQVAGIVLVAFGVTLMGETAISAFVQQAAAALLPLMLG